MTINKEIAKLHFITAHHPTMPHAEQAIQAYNAGCKWVQLRMKDSSDEQIIEEALKIVPVANAHHAILLINDNPHIALQTKAHGVHLGKNDISPIEARHILGNNMIIGGTANTLEDVLSLINNQVDYIGLGPFRFTTTKKKLSPILGKAGYEAILSNLKEKRLEMPIVAIGGIIASDIEILRKTGIHRIALSGAILANNNIEDNITKYEQLINS